MSRSGSPRSSLPALKGLPLLAVASVLRPTLPRLARDLSSLARSQPSLLGDELAKRSDLEPATRKQLQGLLTAAAAQGIQDELALVEREVPDDREELCAFAEAHGIAFLLKAAASKVLGTSSTRGVTRLSGKGTLTVLELACGSFQCAPSGSPLDDLRRRGELLLHARRAIATEAYAQRKWQEAADGLWEREVAPGLRSMIDSLRSLGSQEPLRRLPETAGRTSLTEQTLRYHEGKIEVRADIETEGASPNLACTCAAPSCGHVSRAADAMLEWCLTVTETEAASLQRRRCRPGWELLLEELQLLANDPVDAHEEPAPRAAHVVLIDEAEGFERPWRTQSFQPTPSLDPRESTSLPKSSPDDPAAERRAVIAYLRSLNDPRVTDVESYVVEKIPLHLHWELTQGGAVVGSLATETLDALFGDPPSGATELWTVDVPRRRVHVVPLRPVHHRLRELLAAPDIAVPLSEAPALLERLVQLERVIHSRLPAVLVGTEVTAAPKVLLHVVPHGGVELRLRLLVLPFPGCRSVAPAQGELRVAGILDGCRVTVVRDFDEEQVLVAQAQSQLKPYLQDTSDGSLVVPAANADALFDAVAHLEHIVIEWPEGHGHFVPPTEWAEEHLSVVVRRGRDWLTVAGGPKGQEDFGTMRHLLDGMQSGRAVIDVPPHGRVALSEGLRERLQTASIAMYPFGEEVRLGRGAVPLLGGSIGTLLSTEGATDAWHELIQGHADRNLDDTSPPAEIQARLRPYQESGFAWLRENAALGMGCVLADEMGLGKTLQTITLLQARSALGPALIAAPTSLCFNWQRELARFAPQLRVHLLEGRARLKRLEALAPGDVLIASYGVLVNELEGVARTRFGTAVFDEAQALKNPNARRTRAMRRIQATARVAISGTPIENHLGELWSIFSVVQPSLLGPLQSFSRRFQGPIERDGDRVAHQSLMGLISPYLLRRTKDEVAKDLPERIEVNLPIELSLEERRLYEAARKHAEVDAIATLALPPEQARIRLLASLTRLRRIACHPRLDDAESTTPSSKLERCLRIVADLVESGSRALLFSQFTSHLKIVEEAIHQLGIPTLYLDGATPKEERARRVDAFQRHDAPVFLISLKAGGAGLNLTAADYVIHLDPWWNPAAEDQATDRAHRIGQTRPVTVYRLIAADTIEERVLDMHDAKRALADNILDDATGVLQVQQLSALLSSPSPS